MKRLKLEMLRVESFETAAAPDLRGTVRAHAWTDKEECPSRYRSDCTFCNPTDAFDCYTRPWDPCV